jgi:hypothetical protein
MYRCEICKTLVGPNVPSHKVVVEIRPVQYPHRRDANHFTKNRKIEKRDDPGGSGVEIAREVIACPRCAGRS